MDRISPVARVIYRMIPGAAEAIIQIFKLDDSLREEAGRAEISTQPEVGPIPPPAKVSRIPYVVGPYLVDW